MMKVSCPLILLLLAATASGHASARRVRTGPAKTPVARIAAITMQPDTMMTDTIQKPDPSTIRLSGFDKTLQATKESFFVTNALPDSMTIIELNLRFDYLDMSGRQLHQADHCVKCHIPTGQTRQITVSCWDRQHAFYYYLSVKPRRAATAFKVKSSVIQIIAIRE